MAKVPNPFRRQGTYHFRRSIPKGLRRVLSRIELTRSLRTTGPEMARRRAARLFLKSEALLGFAERSVTVLDEDHVQQLAREPS